MLGLCTQNPISFDRANKNSRTANAQYLCLEEDLSEAKMSQYLTDLILNELKSVREKYVQGRLLIPCDLPSKVARDTMRMSRNEPCGIRGCTLLIVFEDSEMCKKVGKVQIDPNTVTTFELTLILHIDSQQWLVKKLPALFRSWSEPTTTVRPGFKITKNKLYRRDRRISELQAI
ncbi:protein scylla-like isoform X2 [Anneissia japonica]|uniref:protein scylla-like isoform X2 n=1 Tax=Anneissia japonica TaxID=1529436 RepID=UPI00142575DB|nr:protein scylla-like isoform X2 [Anneissia japonica]